MALEGYSTVHWQKVKPGMVSVRAQLGLSPVASSSSIGEKKIKCAINRANGLKSKDYRRNSDAGTKHLQSSLQPSPTSVLSLPPQRIHFQEDIPNRTSMSPCPPQSQHYAFTYPWNRLIIEDITHLRVGSFYGGCLYIAIPQSCTNLWTIAAPYVTEEASFTRPGGILRYIAFPVKQVLANSSIRMTNKRFKDEYKKQDGGLKLLVYVCGKHDGGDLVLDLHWHDIIATTVAATGRPVAETASLWFYGNQPPERNMLHGLREINLRDQVAFAEGFMNEVQGDYVQMQQLTTYLLFLQRKCKDSHAARND